MKIFLASSREALEEIKLIALWIEELGHHPLPWDAPEVFIPGEYTLAKLIEISRSVDAAIFLFGEDDKMWYRTTIVQQPRDNVLIEYGLFAGVLGPDRAIICKKGVARSPTDLDGLVHVNLYEGKELARARIRVWIGTLEKRGRHLYASGVREEMLRIVADNRQVLDNEYRKGKISAKRLDVLGIALSSALSELADDDSGDELLNRVLFNNAQVRMMFLSPYCSYVKQRAVEDGDSVAQLTDLLKRSFVHVVKIFERFERIYNRENGKGKIRPAAIGFLEIRVVDFCPHFTIYRTDDTLLWGLYTSATRGDHSAVLKVERVHGALFRQLIQHFDKLWHMGLLDPHTAENTLVKCHSRIPPALNEDLVERILGKDWRSSMD